MAIISMHPAPYRDPLFAEVTARHGDAIEILSLHRETTHREWDLGPTPYRTTYLPDPLLPHSRLRYHRGLAGRLLKDRFDIVLVPGYMPVALLLVALQTLKRGGKLIYSADTIATSVAPRPRAISRYLAARSSALWVPGGASRALWESEGVPADRIFEGSYTISEQDIDLALLRSAEYLPRLARELDIVDRFVYLFVGKLIPSRQIGALIRQYLRIPHDDSALVVIGDGPQSDIVDAAAASHPEANIRRVASVSFSELHRYYGIANAFVHPGAEPYSLALQEAAFLGLPIVATRAVGAARDFVAGARNGIEVEPNDDASLRSALREIRRIVRHSDDSLLARKRGIGFAVGQFEEMLEAVECDG